MHELYYEWDPGQVTKDYNKRIEIHTKYLDSLSTTDASLKTVFGYMYLANDYIVTSNYTSAMEALIKAEELCLPLNNDFVLGRINHKKGAVFSLLENYQEAIKFYNKALNLNKMSNDNFYYAITLEQLGARYADLNDYNRATEYYAQAIPLVKEHCSPQELSTTLINYGNALDESGKPIEAIHAYKEAIAIGESIHDDYEVIPAKQNLALVYALQDSLSESYSLYHECRLANEKNGWLDFLIYSYDGLALVHEKLNNQDSALFYLKKFQSLKDSIMGTPVQASVNDQETNRLLKNKDEELSQLEMYVHKLKNSKMLQLLMAVILLSISALFIYFLYRRKHRTEKYLKESQSSLKKAHEIIASKSAELESLIHLNMAERSNLSHTEFNLLERINMFDFRILTDKDWLAFKRLFERSYPSFFKKIRDEFPDISEAEERLFIFIKLNISNKESASILGIQPDTVKKTRSRLRKRLGLTPQQELNDFVSNFY